MALKVTLTEARFVVLLYRVFSIADIQPETILDTATTAHSLSLSLARFSSCMLFTFSFLSACAFVTFMYVYVLCIRIYMRSHTSQCEKALSTKSLRANFRGELSPLDWRENLPGGTCEWYKHALC